MVPVNGTRLIDRLLGQLSGLALNRVIIVVGYQGQKLIDYIGHRYDNQLKASRRPKLEKRFSLDLFS